MKNRFFAWLLIIALLAMACPAFADELTVELPEGEDAVLSNDLGIEIEGIGLDFDGEGGKEISAEMPNLDLSDALADDTLGNVESNGEANGRHVVSYRPKGGYDNDALFAGYVELLFNGNDMLGLRSNNWLGDRLTGVAADVYEYLRKQILEVGLGNNKNTVFHIPKKIVPSSALEEALGSIDSIVEALLGDTPYHLFWFDKTAGTRWWTNDVYDGVYVAFYVAEEFHEPSDSTYTVTDLEKIKSVQFAHDNAEKIARFYDGLSDYKKICGYRDFICDAVEYNDDAISDPDTPYGNPWQMIWVFDGDPDTNVVCEGYAKAFHYLCEHGQFNGAIQSHIVQGDVETSNGSGPHMWNLVTMEDGKSYHVDVTWYDDGFTEGFLAGATEQSGDLRQYIVADKVHYTYDQIILDMYPAKALTIADYDYDPDSNMPQSISIKQGDSATLYMGNKLTLKAIVEPSKAVTKLKWSSNYTKVATVSQKGVVTPKKAGRAKITVTTDNGLSASIIVKVVDAKSVKLKLGGKIQKKGKTISLKRGKSLTLKAVVSPAKVKTKLTWSSSSKYVTVKNGKVTVSAIARVGTKAKITVKTANGKSTYVYIKVK